MEEVMDKRNDYALIDRNQNEEVEPEYVYFIDYFDIRMRHRILSVAAEFGDDAEKFIFTLRRPVDHRLAKRAPSI
jgi:hypothetical protein